ncbi:unnamed protein product [Phytophthora lilii]|uniref:Unnamed protein product n=1 Tax=Phytophthora lilii TaxID=2077276 RepID=A0A9W6TCL7_9STRA|nr:unnamed protein product [Phytophthora lilii]
MNNVMSIALYYNDAVIFVVDAADIERIDDAKTALHQVFEAEELVDSNLLVFANKQDQPNAISVKELRQRMGLENVTMNATHVQACVATTGDGMYEGLDWLAEAVTQNISIERPKINLY